MTEVREPDMLAIVDAVKRLTASSLDAKVDDVEVERLLRRVLYEPRDLWWAVTHGVVTEDEVVGAVGAHVQSWLMHELQLSWEEPMAVRSGTEFERAVRSALFGRDQG